MKRFRKLVSIILAISILSSLFMLDIQAAFTDVSYDNECLDEINYAVDNGVMLPTSTTKFSPNTNVTRAQVVYALYKESRDADTYSTNSGFNDVSTTAYYASAVTWARDKGIAGGTSANGFSPDAYVKRQDLAVFIYRYANYMGHDTGVPSSFSLTDQGYTDIDDISSYAIEAVTWAVYNGLIRGTSATGFAPASYMARRWFANVVAYYSQHIEGFAHNVDGYSFANDGYIFDRSRQLGHYYVNDADTQRLEYTINSFSSENKYLRNVMSFLNQTFNKKNGEFIFKGSCFGMSVTAALDKIGKININARTTEHNETVYSIGSLNNYEGVESAINYYHVLQYAEGIQKDTEESKTHDDINRLLNTIDEENFAVFKYLGYYFDSDNKYHTVGHAIIIYGYSSLGIPGLYNLYVYDNRYPNAQTFLELDCYNESDMSMILRKSSGYDEIVHEWYAYDTLDSFDVYDIDGYDNAGTFVSNGNSSSLLAIETSVDVELDNDDMYLFVYANNFRLNNSQGESLICNFGDFSGEIEVLSTDFIVSDGEHVEWCIKVNSDDYALYVDTEELVAFNVLTPTKCYGISGKQISSILMKKDGNVIVEGEDSEYTVVGNAGEYGLNIQTIGTAQ